MSGQGLIFRLHSLLSTTRLFTNRVQIHTQSQLCSVKQNSRNIIESLNIPEKPKKPMSSYLRFVQEHRDTIKQQHPDWKMTEITRKCAEDWRNAHPTIKEKYEITAKKEYENYSQNYLKYMSSLTEVQKDAIKDIDQSKRTDRTKRKKKKKQKLLNKPKRPVGAYTIYVLEQKEKPQNKSKLLIQLLQDLRDTWYNLPDAEKAKYNLIADEKKKVYEIELKLWENEMIKEGNLDLVRKRTLIDVNPTHSKEPEVEDEHPVEKVKKAKAKPASKVGSTGRKTPE